jgi:acetyltransferase-like isoleucine patch superfamily enzyme
MNYKRIFIKVIKHTTSCEFYGRFLGVKIGNNCRIYTKLFGTEPWLVEIGDNVAIARGVVFLTHDASTWLMNDNKGRRFLYRRIVIGNNVMIGFNSIILPGVKIDDNVIIGAGSVVAKSVPTGSIIAGNPAKIIGNFDNYKDAVLDNYYSFNDLDFKLSYKERVLKILTNDFKDYLKK